jgi:hypothetical protein
VEEREALENILTAASPELEKISSANEELRSYYDEAKEETQIPKRIWNFLLKAKASSEEADEIVKKNKELEEILESYRSGVLGSGS